ncbi:MAG TPA: XdhC family protein [Dehalococcoidia bacterium]|nr:XdhC family protein [Dehalococcoidia bacterium]
MEKEVYEEIGRCLDGSAPVVLATVAKARGSTPRSPGATMVVRPDGSALGTIGGGCGEAEVWSVAMDVLATGLPRLVTVNLTEPIDGDDKICGGVMEVWVERVP